MAAIPLTIQNAVITQNTDGTFTISGMANITGLGVGGGPAQPPLSIWPNPPEGQAPLPEHPIVLPPDLPPVLPPPDSRPIDWKVAWTPSTGWVVIGVPTGPHPVPSK